MTINYYKHDGLVFDSYAELIAHEATCEKCKPVRDAKAKKSGSI